jgi:hypothetical protein
MAVNGGSSVKKKDNKVTFLRKMEQRKKHGVC